MGDIHQQDEGNLRSVLGLQAREDPIPQPIVDVYKQLATQKARVIAGPMSVASLLLVVHISKGMDLVPKPAPPKPVEKPAELPAQPAEKLPGSPFPGSEGTIQPDIAMVEGKEFWVQWDGEWCNGAYVGLARSKILQGAFRFNLGGGKIVEVGRGALRMKE